MLKRMASYLPGRGRNFKNSYLHLYITINKMADTEVSFAVKITKYKTIIKQLLVSKKGGSDIL